MILQARRYPSAALVLTQCCSSATVHRTDGGLVDTTGIVALLQRGVRRIIAFYDNNDNLAPAATGSQSELASIACVLG